MVTVGAGYCFFAVGLLVCVGVIALCGGAVFAANITLVIIVGVCASIANILQGEIAVSSIVRNVTYYTSIRCAIAKLHFHSVAFSNRDECRQHIQGQPRFTTRFTDKSTLIYSIGITGICIELKRNVLCCYGYLTAAKVKGRCINAIHRSVHLFHTGCALGYGDISAIRNIHRRSNNATTSARIFSSSRSIRYG